uniref:Uncharacterized protein n=1 Tax=Leersia perrieri TaxID=77586 RepID=A0A0D9WEV6_9ORYZ
MPARTRAGGVGADGTLVTRQDLRQVQEEIEELRGMREEISEIRQMIGELVHGPPRETPQVQGFQQRPTSAPPSAAVGMRAGNFHQTFPDPHKSQP